MESLLCLTFQVRDVNEEHGNMVHNYLLDKNGSIDWGNADTIPLASLTGSPPADPPDDDPSDDNDQHKPHGLLGNGIISSGPPAPSPSSIALLVQENPPPFPPPPPPHPPNTNGPSYTLSPTLHKIQQ